MKPNPETNFPLTFLGLGILLAGAAIAWLSLEVPHFSIHGTTRMIVAIAGSLFLLVLWIFMARSLMNWKTLFLKQNRMLDQQMAQRTAALKESEAKSRLVIETAFDAFIAIDAKGIITDWNRRAEIIFGWPREEAVGRSLAETIVPPQHRHAHLKGLQHFLTTGEGPLLNKRTEITALSRDGHEFPVEITIWPIRLDGGYIFNAFIHDITERKISERELTRLSSFPNENPSPMVELNAKGEVTFLNPAAGNKFPDIFQLGLRHPLLKHLGSIWQDFLTEDKKILAHEVQVGEEVYQQRIVSFDRGRRVCVYSHEVTPLKRAESDLQKANEELKKSEERLFKSFLELEKAHEELKAYQNQLIDSEKSVLMGQVAGGVAHEIKNPLAILMQGMDFLTRRLKGQEDGTMTSVLKDMIDAVERTDYTVRGLLDISRPGQLMLEPESLNSIVEGSLLLVKNQADNHQVRIKKDLDPRLHKFSADRGRMQHVFINLFMNAIEAMADNGGGELLVRTYTKKLDQVGSRVGQRKEDIFRLGDEVLVTEIEDDGPGIPQEILNKVFDPFFTTKRGRGGTGLGLAVVKSVVEMHRGTVQVGNRPQGGAHIVIRFPSLGANP